MKVPMARHLSKARRWVAARALGTGLFLMGCAAEHDPDPADRMAAEFAPSATIPVTIAWKARVGASAFACGQRYPGVGAAGGTTIEAADFRLYVHDLRLIDHAGNEVPLTLEEDNKWQHRGVALLDFEDKTGACTGTKDVNSQVRGTVPSGNKGWNGIRFKLGVPFALNHADVATAPSPLNLTSMFWSWQGGYKFLRIEGQNAGGFGFILHLGSTGCMKDGSGAVTACAHENRAEITLDGFDPSKQAIVADLATLFSGTDLSKEVECMSGPGVADCLPLFERLGLPYGTAPAGPQRLFFIE